MGFDFGAFVGGFSTGAADAITARNKEIRTGAVKEFDKLVADAESKEKGLRTKRDVTKTQAQVLANARGLNGEGLTENQILGIIQVPEYAKQLVKKLESTEDLSQVDLSQVFKVEKPGTKMTPEEYIAKSTSIAKGEPQTQPTKVAKGAFGLSSNAYNQAEQDFLRNTGRKVADVRSAAQGAPDLGADFEPVQGQLNLAQFAKPESVADLQNKLGDAIARGEDPKSPKLATMQKQLSARTSVREMFKDKAEGDKPRPTAAITSTIDRSLKANLYPYEKSGVIRWEKDNPEPIIMAGATEKQVSDYIEVKNKHIASVFQDLGIIDKNTNLINPKDRNARDALLPYANVDGKR